MWNIKLLSNLWMSTWSHVSRKFLPNCVGNIHPLSTVGTERLSHQLKYTVHMWLSDQLRYKGAYFQIQYSTLCHDASVSLVFKHFLCSHWPVHNATNSPAELDLLISQHSKCSAEILGLDRLNRHVATGTKKSCAAFERWFRIWMSILSIKFRSLKLFSPKLSQSDR